MQLLAVPHLQFNSSSPRYLLPEHSLEYCVMLKKKTQQTSLFINLLIYRLEKLRLHAGRENVQHKFATLDLRSPSFLFQRMLQSSADVGERQS